MPSNIYPFGSTFGNHLKELEVQAARQRQVRISSIAILEKTKPYIAPSEPLYDGRVSGMGGFTAGFSQAGESAKISKPKKAKRGFWARLFGRRAR